MQFSGSCYFSLIFIFHIDIVYECIVLRCIVENKLTYLLTYFLPVMWSFYHAVRSDVVGRCRQSIEALLPLFYEKAATSDYDSTWHGASENDYRVPKSATISLLVVDQTLCDIRHYYLGNLWHGHVHV